MYMEIKQANKPSNFVETFVLQITNIVNHGELCGHM